MLLQRTMESDCPLFQRPQYTAWRRPASNDPDGCGPLRRARAIDYIERVSESPAPLRVSFIIPALNEAAHIERAVESAWAAGAAEVIVVDGGSEDATCELASAAGAHVLKSPRGRAVQQNTGAAAASGEVLLFQHADNRCAPASVDQIRAALADSRVLGGAFRQRIEADGLLFRLLEFGNALRVRLFRLPYGDQGIFLRREVFDRLGGFPEVPLLEDVLLMQSFRRLGRPVLLSGPHYVSPRRWQARGIVRQTLRNWGILLAHTCGASPERLAHFYSRNDARDASVAMEMRSEQR